MRAEDVGKAAGTALVVIGGAAWAWWKARKVTKSLPRHPFFAKCAEIQRWARHLPIDDPMRREAFQDLLQIKLGIWHHELEHWARETPIRHMDADALASNLHEFIDRIVDRYTERAEATGIPAPVTRKFNDWHAPAVAGAHAFIDAICDSDWLTTPDMAASFLSWMLAALEQTRIHAEEALADLNGEINGLTYKGFVAQPYESPKRRRRRASRDGDRS